MDILLQIAVIQRDECMQRIESVTNKALQRGGDSELLSLS